MSKNNSTKSNINLNQPENLATFDNYLHVGSSYENPVTFEELVNFQNTLFTAIPETPYPEWPEYAERGYLFKIDFEKIRPIPEGLLESERSKWMFENWGVYSNAEDTLLMASSTLACYPDAPNLCGDDYIEVFFETNGVPLPVIWQVIKNNLKFDIIYSYYDQQKGSAGEINSVSGEISEVHYSSDDKAQIIRIGQNIFGYEDLYGSCEL